MSVADGAGAREEGAAGAPEEDGGILPSVLAGAEAALRGGAGVVGGGLFNGREFWVGFFSSSTGFFFRLKNDNYLMQLLISAK